MSDFRIRLTTDVQKGNADEQLNAIISKLENKKIKMKFDTSDFRTQVSQLQKAMNNAFKLDPKQLSNLNTLKTTLQEINKLSKQAQKSIFGTQGSSGMKSEVVTVQSLVKQYDNLLAKQKMIEIQMSKTTNAQSYAVLAKQLTQVRSQSDAVGKSLDKLGATKGSANITNSLANSFQSVQKQIDATITKINGLFKNKNLGKQQATELARLKQELIGLQNVNLNNIINADKPYAEMSKLMRGASELKLALNNLNIKIKFNDQIEKSKSSIDGLISKLQTLGKSGFSDKTGIANILSQLQKLKTELGNINPNSSNATAQLKEIANSINQCEQKYRQLDSAMQSSKAKFKFDTNFSKTLSDLQQLRQECIAAGQSTSQVDKLERELRQLGNVELDKASAGLQKIRSEMASIKSSMTGMNKSTTGVQRAFGNLYSTLTIFSLGNLLATQIQQGVYAIKDTIINLDSAFRDLMKVAPDSFRGSKQELDDLRNKAISTGQTVAKSSVDIINSTANALQSGFKNVDEALKYAERSAVASNVFDMSQEDTDTALRSILSSYGGVEQSLKGTRTQIQGATKDYNMMSRALDSYNYVSNNYAVSAENIAQGMQNAGSSLKTMGVDLETGVAYFTAIDEIMQNSGKSSNGLKAIAQNMTSINVSAKDGSLKLNKSALALKEYANINVNKPNGELRDMTDVLDELGGKWDTLNKTQQQALMIGIGGKQRSSQFAALMDNWETVKKIQQEISSGKAIASADKENARFIDSIQGRIVKLKEELGKLVTSTISTDMFKGFISGLTNVFSAINSVIGAFDKLGVATPVVTSGLLGMVMTIKSLATGKNVTNLGKTFADLATSGRQLNNVKTALKESSTQFTTLSAGATKYSGVMRVAASSSDKFNNIMRQTTVVADTSGKKVNIMTKGVAQAQKSLGGIGTSLANIGGTLVSSLGNAALIAGVGIAISLATQAWYEYAHAAEIAMEKHEENISKINSKMSELKNEKSSLKSVAKEYDELASKTNKTSEEQARYNELRNQIAEISPELLVGTDSDNNAILSLNGSLESYINNLDSAIKKQRELLMQQQNAEASDASDYLQQGVNNNSYKKYERASVTADVENQKIEKATSSITKAMNRFNANTTKSFENSIEKIQTARENHVQQIEDSYNRVAEEQEKINEYGSKLKQKALNKVETNNQLEKTGDDVRAFAQTVTSSLDFSSLKSGQIDTYARNIGKALSDGNIDDVLLKYKVLREELNKTGDTFTYEKAIKSLIPGMADLLGVNEDVIKSMTKLDPTLTQATSALDSYLQSFGKRESMRGFDIETDNLIKQYESFNTLMDDLGNLDAQEINGEVQFDITAVTELVNQEDIPQQVKNLFSQMQLDGKFTDEEMKVMMKISAAMTTSDSTERDRILDDVQSWIDQTFPNSEIDIGKLNVKAEYDFNSGQFSEELSGILKGEKNKQIKIDIETAVQFGDIETLQSKLNELPTEKQVAIINSIQQAGGMSPEELKQLLTGLPNEVNKQINVSTPGADESNNKLERVNENSQGKNKKVTTSAPGAEETISKEKQVDANSKNKSKTVSVSAPGASSTANILHDINSNARSKTITITTIFKQIGKAISGFFGGGGHGTQSVGNFSNISDTPQQAEMSAMSMTSQPTVAPSITSSNSTGTTSGVSNSYASTSSSGEMSTMASVSPIDTVFTAPSKATKISTAYSNIWNTIKYGINLFQELENRIKKVSNNVDVLGAKLENASGTKKISYLQQQNKLYKEQASLTNTLYKSLMAEKTALAKKSKTYGFGVNEQGNLTNYEENLLKLEQAAEKAEKKSSDYSGKSDKTKKSLEKSADKAKKKLEEARTVSDAFLKLQNEEIPNARSEWIKLQNSIKENNDEVEKLKLNLKTLPSVNGRIANDYDKNNLQSELNRLETQGDSAQGKKKIDILKEQNKVLAEQIKLNKENIDYYKDEKKSYRGTLGKYGLKFDKNGDMLNAESVLNKYSDSADYDKIKELIEEYGRLNEEQDNLRDENEQLQKQMEETFTSIKVAELENQLSSFTNNINESNKNIQRLQNNLDVLGIKFDNAYGEDKLNILKEQIELQKQLKAEQENQLNSLNGQQKTLQSELSNNGFKFDASGNISNQEEALKSLENTDSYEYVKSVLEQWESVHDEEIPNAIKSIADYDKAIKDSYNNQLNITKEIEDKITDMLKKQIEDKKKAIEKETETIRSEIEKRKKAYQDERKEAEYKNDYEEKANNVSDLKKDLENAKKDTSLGNKKRIADLEKQLADAEKDLDKFVQDKIDEDVLSGYDKEMDAVEEKNNKAIEDLDNTWTEEKLAEAVKNAMSTGLFTGIDGEVSNLQESMLTFAETSGEALGVMGQSIKDNLIANLGIALDTLKNYSDIANGLGLTVATPTSTPNTEPSNKSINTGNISINIQTKSNADENVIAKAVQVAVEDALKGTIEGL